MQTWQRDVGAVYRIKRPRGAFSLGTLAKLEIELHVPRPLTSKSINMPRKEPPEVDVTLNETAWTATSQ